MLNEFILTDKTAIEALILSSSSSVGEEDIKTRLGYSPDIRKIVAELNRDYSNRSIEIFEVAPNQWAARTRPEMSDLCRKRMPRPLKISRAGYETLAVIAYFQPVTRSEIERVRGVSASSGIIEVLIYAGFVKLGPRRKSPGNPMTFMTTDQFLLHFNIRSIENLPNYDEMKRQGLLNAEKGITMGMETSP